jgi:hypothetical protein
MIENKLTAWLGKRGFGCCRNFVLGGRFPDIIAVKDNKIIAFEIKKHANEITTAMGQCLFYLNDSNKTYIVMPEKEEELLSDTTIKTLKRSGIGLIVAGKELKTLVKPREFRKDNLSVVKQLKERMISPVKEFSKEEDYIKTKIVETLRDHPEGLSFLDLSKYTSVSRFTIAKYIMVLEVEGQITQRNVGAAKLCCIKENLHARK